MHRKLTHSALQEQFLPCSTSTSFHPDVACNCFISQKPRDPQCRMEDRACSGAQAQFLAIRLAAPWRAEGQFTRIPSSKLATPTCRESQRIVQPVVGLSYKAKMHCMVLYTRWLATQCGRWNHDKTWPLSLRVSKITGHIVGTHNSIAYHTTSPPGRE